METVMNNEMVTKEQLLIAKEKVIENIRNGLFCMNYYEKTKNCGTAFCIGGTMRRLGFTNLSYSRRMPDIIKKNKRATRYYDDNDSYLFHPQYWKRFSPYSFSYGKVESMPPIEQEKLISKVIDAYILKYYGEVA